MRITLFCLFIVLISLTMCRAAPVENKSPVESKCKWNSLLKNCENSESLTHFKN